MSLARNWKKRVQSGNGPDPSSSPMVVGPGGLADKARLFALLDASLETDAKALGDIAAIERKVELKRSSLVPKYEPYVEQLKASGLVHPLLGQMTVWLFDIGDIERGLALGSYCLEVGAELPERFARKGGMRTFLADAVLAWAEDEHKAGRTVGPYFTGLFDMVDRTKPRFWDVPDPLAAKYHRLAGIIAGEGGYFGLAAANLKKALELGASVKTKLAEVEAKLAAMDSALDKATGVDIGAATETDPDAGPDTND